MIRTKWYQQGDFVAEIALLNPTVLQTYEEYVGICCLFLIIDLMKMISSYQSENNKTPSYIRAAFYSMSR
jgi:hypothetical protein